MAYGDNGIAIFERSAKDLGKWLNFLFRKRRAYNPTWEVTPAALAVSEPAVEIPA